MRLLLCARFFFFQAEDGIRDKLVTGVQTCALPISRRVRREALDGLLHGVEKVGRVERDGDRILRHEPLDLVVDLLALGALERRPAGVEQLVGLLVVPPPEVLAARRRVEVAVEGPIGVDETSPPLPPRRRLDQGLGRAAVARSEEPTAEIHAPTYLPCRPL